MLEALGISASQQELYELLLSSAPVKQDRLHKLTAARPWAGRLDAMMTALEELGLVAQHPGAEPQYVVVSPAAALDTAAGPFDSFITTILPPRESATASRPLAP